MTTKSDAKFEEKLTLGFKHDIKNLVNFHPRVQNSSSRVTKFHFDKLFLSKVYEA